jgi:hypothetical protein
MHLQLSRVDVADSNHLGGRDVAGGDVAVVPHPHPADPADHNPNVPSGGRRLRGGAPRCETRGDDLESPRMFLTWSGHDQVRPWQVQDICGEWVKVPPDIAVARIKMAKLLEVWGEEWGQVRWR